MDKTKKMHLSDLHFEHELWAMEVKFYREELKLYQKLGLYKIYVYILYVVLKGSYKIMTQVNKMAQVDSILSSQAFDLDLEVFTGKNL